MTAPQERPVAGDGLDLDAIERRAEEAAECLALLSKPPTGFVARSAADVPALLAALRAAEAEVERLRDLLGHVVKVHGSVGTSELVAMRAALRTEGGAS